MIAVLLRSKGVSKLANLVVKNCAGAGRMQTSGLYASALPHPLYHPPYHPVLPGPQDHELKKQYLSLLPPHQIIDICLNFDLHVPPYVKSTIWPPDINAAIAAIQKTSPPATDTPVASSSTSNGKNPPASSSTESPQPSSTTEKSIEQPAEVQPPDKPISPLPETSTDAKTSAQSSTASTEQTTSATTSAPATASTAPHQPPYPHQPYGYGHPQAAYPHAPYYQTPPGYPPYPSPYPYPLPGQFPQPHPTYPQPNTAPYPPPPHTHAPPQPQDVFHSTSADDLPSYEEMIAEALTDSADPEGCAPKDLYTWMATRYPLQQNFRPSASQALQKAFKRGRFLKSSNGKYKLNTTWEGGTTTRRTTRRPQTQNPSSASSTPASPFTHAPLIHHNQPSQTPAFQIQPFGYQYQQQSAQNLSGFTQPAQPGQTQTTAPGSTSATTAPTTGSDASQASSSVQDAWEAAQNILKAINFDTLLSLPKEESNNNNLETNPPPAGPSAAVPPSTSAPLASDVPPNTADGSAPASIVTGTENQTAGRAELQAHLALLAAQLAELSQEDEDTSVVHYPVVTSPSAPLPPPAAPVPLPIASFPPSPLFQSQPQPMPLYLPPVDSGEAQQPVPPIPPAVPLPPPPRPVEVMPVEEEEEEDSEDDDDMEAVI
ncbi:hypothetical protein E4T56_gene16732 [Termitomyces sp. T112]|nr:hypothetical protein E4T56_gene16732 [Termitomyces sp. T112]